MGPSRARGFTLLEVLLVILVIALFSGLVGMLNPDSGTQQVRREGERLRGLLQLLREQAVLTNSEYGVRFEPDGYAVQRLEEHGRWTPNHEFARQTLAPNLSLSLETTDLLEHPYQGHDVPQLLVLSSDETTPFTLWLAYRRQPLLSLSSDGIQEPLLEPVE